MSNYLGETAIPGLSEMQNRAVEAAIGGAPAIWHDSLLREIFAVLGGTTPDNDFVLKSAIAAVLEANGIAQLHPYAAASTAFLNGNVTIAGYVSQKQTMPTTGPINATAIVVAILAAVQLLTTALGGNGTMAANIVKA